MFKQGVYISKEIDILHELILNLPLQSFEFKKIMDKIALLLKKDFFSKQMPYTTFINFSKFRFCKPNDKKYSILAS